MRSFQYLLCVLLTTAFLSAGAEAHAQAPPILLQRCYGGDSTDQINCIRQTPDGGFIAVGMTLSVNGDLAGIGGIRGIWVLKLDGMANIEWQKTYYDSFVRGSYIEPTSDGGYILTGSQTIKLRADGAVDWSLDQQGVTIHQTADSGYILCNGYGTPAVVKLHRDGSVQWQKAYNAVPPNSFDPFYTINDAIPANSGGYMITGGYSYDVGGTFAFISKIDDTGHILPPFNELASHGSGLHIVHTPDGKYVMAGNKTNYYIISKYDDTCGVYWNRQVQFNHFYDVAATFDHSYLACGINDSNAEDMLFVMFDDAGNVIWKKDISGPMQDIATSVIQAYNGNYVAAGYSSSNSSDITGNHGGEDGVVVIFGTNVSVHATPDPAGEVVLYPIPASQSVSITLPPGFEEASIQVFDMMGRKVGCPVDGVGLNRSIRLTGLPAATFLLRIEGNGSVINRKIVHL